MPRTVFVSYARKDSERIQQAVALLEAGGAEVFRDIDDIEFGDDWEEVITRKLQECERVMVFWSANAQASEWVGKEYTIALAQHKRMVPVLLDNTPLPPELGKYHALTNFMPRRPAWKKYGGWVVGGVALIVLAGVVAVPPFQQPVTGEPLVAERVEIPALAENSERPRPAANSANPDAYYDYSSSAASDYYTPPAAIVAPDTPYEPGVSDPVDATPMFPAIERLPLPLFALGIGLLALLLLLLVWFRQRNTPVLSANDETDAKQFVELVFDEK